MFGLEEHLFFCFLICAFIIVFYQTEEMSESSILVLEVQLESHSTEQATRRR